MIFFFKTHYFSEFDRKAISDIDEQSVKDLKKRSTVLKMNFDIKTSYRNEKLTLSSRILSG